MCQKAGVAGLQTSIVKIPPFTKGKKQLSKCEVDTAQELSRIRIHIERGIGLLRQKYTILEATLPINAIMTSTDSEYSTIDKIVVVCVILLYLLSNHSYRKLFCDNFINMNECECRE